ncbi:MAG TPA: mechanosensitive ion channel family protein [Nitratifractor sp.]|nr:mechanosensitive ion channel family protein [Nitratifractor sp.]HHD75057.1 mechanosensitive ion channel family protein [Nitratifractor sp.]
MFSIIKRYSQFTLFFNRENIYSRFLYYRVEKIARPLYYLVFLSILKNILGLFYTVDSHHTLDVVLFFLELALILWAFYEIFKFFLYATLNKKIKEQVDARRELFIFLLNIVKISIVLVVVTAILFKMGVDIASLVASLGVGGIIIGFSAKDVLVNFFDSIRLISEDAFRQGDWIETKEFEGFVTELGLTSTKIRTFANAQITIPNSKLANDYIINWSKRLIGRRIKFKIPIQYSVNGAEIDRVTEEIYQMLRSHPDIVNPDNVKHLIESKMTYENGLFNIEDKFGVRSTLLVYVDSVDSYSLKILVYAFSVSINWKEWLRVKQDVLKKVITIVEKSELNLAYPTQSIYLKEAQVKRETLS